LRLPVPRGDLDDDARRALLAEAADELVDEDPPHAPAAIRRLDDEVDPDPAPLAERVPVAGLDAAVGVAHHPLAAPRLADRREDDGMGVPAFLPEPPRVPFLEGWGDEEAPRVHRVVPAGEPGAEAGAGARVAGKRRADGDVGSRARHGTCLPRRRRRGKRAFASAGG